MNEFDFEDGNGQVSAQKAYEAALVEVDAAYYAYRITKEAFFEVRGELFAAEAAYQKARTTYQKAKEDKEVATYDEAFEAAINDGVGEIAAYDVATMAAYTAYSEFSEAVLGKDHDLMLTDLNAQQPIRSAT